jgi:hypothetical protein
LGKVGRCGRDGQGEWVGGWMGAVQCRRVDGWMSPGEGTSQVHSAVSAVRPGPEDSLHCDGRFMASAAAAPGWL